MAKSGSKKVNVTSDGYIYLLFSWSAGTQNIASNYTPVSWNLKLVSTGHGANISSTASKDLLIKIDGDEVFNGVVTIGLSAGATKTLKSGTKNIYHNSDGSKSFSYSFSQEIGINYSGSSIGTKTGSGTGTLDTIPRASTISSITGNTIGSAVTIAISRKSSAFTHKVYYTFGDTNNKLLASNVATSHTFTPSLSDSNYLPKATSGTATIKVETYNGNDLIGSATKTFTLKVPTNIVPTISSVVASENGDTPTSWGVYVKGKSKLKIVTTSSGAYSSTISSVSVTANGQTLSGANVTTNALKTTGANDVKVVVTDSRGRTATKTISVNVLDYAIPTISLLKAVRVDNSGKEALEGTNAKVSFKGNFTSLSGKNSPLSYTLSYKERNATTWIEAKKVILDTNTFDSSFTIQNVDANKSYNIKLVVNDYFDTKQKDIVLQTAFITMDFLDGGRGMALGKVAERENVLDIAFEKTFLSVLNYLGGEKINNAEKNIFFQTTEDAESPSDCKIYGGNGSSSTGIGMWDTGNERQIYSYYPLTGEFRFGSAINITKAGKQLINDVTNIMTENNTGRLKLSNGLLLQWGKVSVTPTTANETIMKSITFVEEYDLLPSIFITPQTSAPNILTHSIGQGGTSTNGFSIYLNRTNTTATSFHWFAIGKKA